MQKVEKSWLGLQEGSQEAMSDRAISDGDSHPLYPLVL